MRRKSMEELRTDEVWMLVLMRCVDKKSHSDWSRSTLEDNSVAERVSWRCSRRAHQECFSSQAFSQGERCVVRNSCDRRVAASGLAHRLGRLVLLQRALAAFIAMAVRRLAVSAA